MKAALSTQGTDPDRLLAMVRDWPGLDGIDMVKEVTCPERFHWRGDAPATSEVFRDLGGRGSARPAQTSEVTEDLGGRGGPRVVLYDFGAKRNIMRHLAAEGLQVIVVPAGTTAEQVLAVHPDGVMLSNGPGDPAGLPYAVEATRQLIAAGVPIFGIAWDIS